MSKFDDLLDVFKRSILNIVGTKGADAEDLLDESFRQFGITARGLIEDAVTRACRQDQQADLLKRGDADKLPAGGKAKGTDPVADFALLLKQTEAFLQSWARNLEDADGNAQDPDGEPEPPPGLLAVARFYFFGRQVLNFLVAQASGKVSDAAGEAADGTAGQETAASPPAAGIAPDAPLLAKVAAIESRLNRISAEKDAALAKADAANTALRAELDALRRSTPAPARGAVMAVGKAADGALHKGQSDADLRREAERLSALSDTDRALELIKVAQANHPGAHRPI